MISFRPAVANDAQQIALLHAASWRHSYRGMLSDTFLAKEVVSDRLAVWQERFQTPEAGQFVLLAEEGHQLQGFICLFANANTQYGALLDNLHIRRECQGQGIGKLLLQKTAVWLHHQHPHSGLYLWVFAANVQAIRFYERLGGQLADEKMEMDFGDKPVRSLRYVWKDVASILPP